MASARFRVALVQGTAADALALTAATSKASVSDQALGTFSVEALPNLPEAIEALSRRSYDVVALAAEPDAHGLATLARLQAATSGIPVVVLTRSTDPSAALPALALGAQDVLSGERLEPGVLIRTLRHAIERRRAQQTLYSALKEKEVLLHELQHRAKNNLQLISSLLKMQARREDDARFQDVVAAAQRRIEAIALAHEQLHGAPDLSRIDFSRYLAALARAVHLAYDGDRRGIALELQVGRCELPLSEAVPCGLLANELLMNSMKHAFPDGRTGTIRMIASQDEGRLLFELSDDGVGSGGAADGSGCRFGMGIVATLAEQLGATFDHRNDGGTRFRLSFASGESA